MYRIAYTEEAKKRIEKLEEGLKLKVREAVEAIARNPYLGKPLTRELRGRWSYRFSDYRIIYEIYQKEIVVLILTVGHRREVYTKLARKMRG